MIDRNEIGAAGAFKPGADVRPDARALIGLLLLTGP